MDPDVTDPMSTQTQHPATSAVTVASPALHNYSTVSNHPGIALSTHHHSHLLEPPGYSTSQWYSATTNHPRPSLAPLEMPRMLANPRYPSVPNASGHGMIQGYPTAYGPQYSEPRYLPPAVVPPTYGGHVPHDYHNTLANWHTQTNPYLGTNMPHSMTMMPYGYLPQRPVVNTLHGNVVNVHNTPHTRLTALPQFRGQSFDRPVNTSHYPPLQRETISPYPNSVRQVPMPNYSAPSYRPLNALYGNQVHTHPSQFIPRPTTPLQFQGQSSEWTINTSQRPPIQRETIPPAVAIDTCTISTNLIQNSDLSSPQNDFDSQSEEGGISLQGTVLPTAPIVSLHNDLPSPAAKRLRMTDSLEQPGLSPSPVSTSSKSISDKLHSHDTRRCLPDPSEENFDFLFEKLYKISAKWYHFGVALGLMTFNLDQISINKRGKCQDCLRETLLVRVRKRHLTWREILEALRKPIVNENALATEIELEMVEMDSLTQAPNSFPGIPSLQELCLLPVDKVWYQLGLWLGVEEYRLLQIKDRIEKTKLLFDSFLESYSFLEFNYRRLTASDMVDAESEGCDDVPLTNVVEISKSLFTQLLTALVKVGKRDVAENICLKKGVLLTDLIDSKPPPECVVMYADYLKSKYREMSILPDPDWPPSIATKEHYTNLALIQKERNDIQTEDDINNVYKDYAHGNVDKIIAKKKNIDLEEAFYPIINLKTNESRLTILMDGAPGVGKTTVTRKVCIDWAEGDVLQEYQFVILVPLRELKIAQKFNQQVDLSDILPFNCKELRHNVIKHIMEVSGAGTLIIFDGFDELSFQERYFLQESFVLDIIKGEKLHLCSVMIISRPYASQPLRSLSRVNRHIEVLGFTKDQIRHCVCMNIPGKEGNKLIQKLKERLDIGSLCYIPLNCRIILFVYKIDFKLPSTITELYEIFLLHTLKHFAQNIVLGEEVSHKIVAAKNLYQIPNTITMQLNALSKKALEGIEQSKLVFDDSSLNDYVSLGLLNSLHCFTTTGEAAFFQFLHLTIQEFLAALYVASAMTDEQRKSFIRSNIENETYRMTLLFLAGLTKFSFLSSGDSLLSPQSTFLSGSSKKERILFLAQIIYESKSSSDYILSDLNESLDMSDYPLTEFDCLVLAHLLSNTPRDFVWEFIDLSNCDITIPTYSVLLKTNHSEHSKLPGIVVSKKLTFSYRKEMNVYYFPIASVLVLLSISKDSPLKELTVPIVKFERCQQIVNIFQSLVDCRSLQTFEIRHEISVSEVSERILSTISREEIVLQKQLHVCSNSLVMLLKFASLEIERLEVIGAEPFIDCSTCGSSGDDAVKSLCEFLGKCKNIEQVHFSECCIKGNVMQSILSSFSKRSTVSSIHIFENNSEICDRELVEMLEHLPRKCTFVFSRKEVGIDLKVSCDYGFFKDYERFLTNIKCVFPQRFTGLSIEVKNTNETVLEHLSHNPNLKMITLTLEIPQDKVVVWTETSKRIILELSESLTSIRIKGFHYDDILEHVAKSVCKNYSLQCMEIIVMKNNHLQTITGLVTLLNSLKSTPVQKLCFKNILFDGECIEALMELLSDNKHLTELAMEEETIYLTDASHTPKSIILLCQTLQIKSLIELKINDNKLKADGTVALLDFIRHNPQLNVLKASDCNLTDDLFTDTHYWETSSLKELTINGNIYISIEGWTNLFQSLRHNTSLIKLNCYCFLDIGDVLNETIISNKCIQYLTIRKHPYYSEYNTESLARALVQNLTLKEITYGFDSSDMVNLKREIRKLKRDKNVTISPEWKLRIQEL